MRTYESKPFSLTMNPPMNNTTPVSADDFALLIKNVSTFVVPSVLQLRWPGRPNRRLHRTFSFACNDISYGVDASAWGPPWETYFSPEQLLRAGLTGDYEPLVKEYFDDVGKALADDYSHPGKQPQVFCTFQRGGGEATEPDAKDKAVLTCYVPHTQRAMLLVAETVNHIPWEIGDSFELVGDFQRTDGEMYHRNPARLVAKGFEDARAQRN